MNKKSKKNQPLQIIPPKKSETENPSLFEKYIWLEYLLVTLIIAILFFLRKNFVGIPMERDEGSYVMYGKWLIEGAKPYIDFYEMKPPGIFLIYALVVKIFGYDYTSLQSGFCFIFAMTLLFSYLFFKNFIGKNVSIAILPVYGFLLLNPFVTGFTIQSEFLVLFFSMTGLFLLLLGSKQENYLIIIVAGIFLGFSGLIKQVGIFYYLFGMINFFIEWLQNRELKKLILKLSALILGGLFQFLVIVFWLYYIGVTKEAFFWVINYPSKYYLNQTSILWGIHLLLMYSKAIIYSQPLFWFLALIGIVSSFFLKISKKNKLLALSFIFFSSMTIFPGLKFYNHYWILFMPGIAISISLAYKLIEQKLKSFKSLQKLIAITYIVIPIGYFVSNFSYYINPDFNDILHNVYEGAPFPETKVIGDFLKSKMNANDQLFVAGSEPQIYVYTNSLGISRHNYIAYLTANTPFAKQWSLEAIHDIEIKKPRFIVMVMNPLVWHLGSNSDQTLYDWIQKNIPEKYKIILLVNELEKSGECDYVMEKDIPNYKVISNQYISVWEKK